MIMGWFPQSLLALAGVLAVLVNYDAGDGYATLIRFLLATGASGSAC